MLKTSYKACAIDVRVAKESGFWSKISHLLQAQWISGVSRSAWHEPSVTLQMLCYVIRLGTPLQSFQALSY